MVAQHKETATILLNGDLRTFLAGPAPPTDANILTYPPGYPIFQATIFKLLGGSDAAVRWLIALMRSVVLLFFWPQSFRTSIGIIAGLRGLSTPLLLSTFCY